MFRGKLAVKLRSNFPKNFVPVASGARLKLAKIRLKRNTSAASQARNIEVTAPLPSEKTSSKIQLHLRPVQKLSTRTSNTWDRKCIEGVGVRFFGVSWAMLSLQTPSWQNLKQKSCETPKKVKEATSGVFFGQKDGHFHRLPHPL